MEIIKNFLFLAAISGLLFGTWPLILKLSGLNAYLGATVYCGIVLCILAILTIWHGTGDLSEVKWQYALFSGLVGALALTAFVYMMTKAPTSEAGDLYLITLLSQTLPPVLYTVVANWERDGFPSLKKTAGILGVFVVAYLLR